MAAVETDQQQWHPSPYSTLQSSNPHESHQVIMLSDPADALESVKWSLCGLYKTKDTNGKIITKRLTKPLFTYEFAQELVAVMFTGINLITVRTTFDEETIRRYMDLKCRKYNFWFSSEGMRNLVSSKAWSEAVKTNWESTPLKIKWNYDTSAYNVEQHNYILHDKGLYNESFGQDLILQPLFWEIMFFIHGGSNKSLAALMLNYERVIYKETLSGSADKEKGAHEGFLDTVKRKLGMGGR